MTHLQALLARCEAAEGPSRRLNAEIWRSLLPDDYRHAMGPASALRKRGSDLKAWEREWAPGAAPPYTASVDATLGLIERVLPGWGFFLRHDKKGAAAGLTYPDHVLVTPGHTKATTPALALLCAMLKAKMAQEEKG